MSTTPSPSDTPEIIGSPNNFWLYHPSTGYDLTHLTHPTSTPVYPCISLKTRQNPITISPSKTALVVIDLQNYFLSPSLGHASDSPGLDAVSNLIKYVIPACRKSGIQVVWLNWGVKPEEVESIPPTILRGFGLGDQAGKKGHPLGTKIGKVRLEDGSMVDAGKALMKDQWNSKLYYSLDAIKKPEDVFVHKNRLSGFWGSTEIEDVLKEKGIRSLLFAGVNTDMCVAGSIQDAMTRGWDCIMLSDGCATTHPKFTTQCIEWSCEMEWGFVISCEEFAKGVETMDYGT